MQEVSGSIPLGSTNFPQLLRDGQNIMLWHRVFLFEHCRAQDQSSEWRLRGVHDRLY